MAGSGITRRHVLATGATITTALALGGHRASAEARAAHTVDIMTFYDPRFPQARPLARTLPQASVLLAVGGDPSLLVAQIAHRRERAGLRLQGVTTETIPFCLEQYTRQERDMHFESRRLNRDLFAWSLEFGARCTAARSV
jgi:hypothetical protein